MTDSKKTESTDLLGLAPYGEAINTVVTKSFEGVEGFLKIVCVPALEELGLLLKDQVRHWRLNNVLLILTKAKGKLEYQNEKLEFKAHPRIALSIIENGSLNDNEEIQELWAGLFASSCTADGQEDENLIFVDLLKQLTVFEARVLKYSCENARKILYKNGLLLGDHLEIHCEQLIQLTNIKDVHRIDRELDHLRSLELIGITGGFAVEDENLVANISPTALALNLFVKSQGFNGAPSKFWEKSVVTKEDVQKEEDEKRIQENEKMRKDVLEKAPPITTMINSA